VAQKLEVFQSLWAMEQRRPGVPERPMEEHFERIAKAGFHGACLDPAVHEIAECLALKPLFKAHGLKCMVNAFPSTVDELPPLLDMAVELDACLVNVIGQVMPLTVAEGVPVIRRWMADAEQAGLNLLFETHRDCTLNDLHYTLQLMDEMPGMRLCADLSHYVIDRELRLPLNDTDRAHFSRILERSDCLQGRVASREQIQVQIDFPQHRQWVEQFRAWWREGMASWKARNDGAATLYFLCELGPPPYAITDARQQELSDRWAEALTIRRWALELWNEVS
jgi:hypothetical protein